MQGVTAAMPLTLKGVHAWLARVAPYYDPPDLECLDRQLFSRGAGVRAAAPAAAGP